MSMQITGAEWLLINIESGNILQSHEVNIIRPLWCFSQIINGSSRENHENSCKPYLKTGKLITRVTSISLLWSYDEHKVKQINRIDMSMYLLYSLPHAMWWKVSNLNKDVENNILLFCFTLLGFLLPLTLLVFHEFDKSVVFNSGEWYGFREIKICWFCSFYFFSTVK